MSIQQFEESNMGKEIRQMSSMTETNSVNITSLISLIKSQNKSLQTLQRQVSLLKDRIPEESDSDTDVEESKREIFCDLCDEKHYAVYHCNDCSENLCETGATFHKKGKATKGHIVKPLSEITLPSPNPEERATAILMELLEEHKITGSVCAGPNDELVSLVGGEICVYNRKGTLLRKFGKQEGIQPGQQPDLSKYLYSPSKLAVSKTGDVFVYDRYHFQHQSPHPFYTKVYGIHGQYKHTIDMSNDQKLTGTGNVISIFRECDPNTRQLKSKCYDEEGNPFPDPSYCDVAQNGDVYATHSTHSTQYIYVFNSSGKYLRKFNQFGESRKSDYSITGIFIFENELYVVLSNYFISVLNLEGIFLYRFRVDRKDQNLSIQNISLFSSGELCVSTSVGVKIFRKGREYIQNSVKRNFHLVPKCREMKEMETKGVLSVTFPLCITVFEDRTGKDRSTIFKHTVYFDSLTTVKDAIFTVEEYFRQKVNCGDFTRLSVLLSLEQECYRKFLNIYDYNWPKCKKDKLVRGYFLGGNVLSSLEIKDETELVLDITQD